jgi:hypothetical protein
MPNVGGGVIVGASGSGGIAPPAGDIGGTAAAPKIIGIDGIPISAAPTVTGQALLYNSGSNQFVPGTPAATLATTNGSLAADFQPTGVYTTMMTTGALAIGIYLVFVNFVYIDASNGGLAVQVAAGGATAAIANPATEIANGVSVASPSPGLVIAIATVTVAGTLVIQAKASNAGPSTIIKSTGQQLGITGITNWSTVKIG